MANQLSVFQFNQSSNVRVVADEKGEFWFCGKDVCDILGYTNDSKALKDHCKQKGVTKRYLLTKGGKQEMTYINEPNLYRLIIKSHKPEAEAFEEWVMEEVLPNIRKTGNYSGAHSTQKPQQTSFLPAADCVALEKNRYIELLEAENRLLRGKFTPKKGKAPVPLSDEEKCEILNLGAQGFGKAEIAKYLKRSRSAVRAILREGGFK